jgi:hypothetical protein
MPNPCLISSFKGWEDWGSSRWSDFFKTLKLVNTSVFLKVNSKWISKKSFQVFQYLQNIPRIILNESKPFWAKWKLFHGRCIEFFEGDAVILDTHISLKFSFHWPKSPFINMPVATYAAKSLPHHFYAQLWSFIWSLHTCTALEDIFKLSGHTQNIGDGSRWNSE